MIQIWTDRWSTRCLLKILHFVFFVHFVFIHRFETTIFKYLINDYWFQINFIFKCHGQLKQFVKNENSKFFFFLLLFAMQFSYLFNKMEFCINLEHETYVRDTIFGLYWVNIEWISKKFFTQRNLKFKKKIQKYYSISK